MSALMGTCRHYEINDDRAPECAAGIKLEGVGCVLPCLSRPLRPGVSECSKREEFTVEEITTAQHEMRLSLDRAVKCIVVIPSGPNGSSGQVACPDCGGTIRYARARSNGHLHAACSTPNCFQVME